MKRWLFLLHRWLGLGGALLMVLWFGSGFVMMYVPYPALTDAERLASLPPLRAQQLALAPPQLALQAPQRLRLLQPDDRPLYALWQRERGWWAVDATQGGPVQVDAAMARRSAQRFAGSAAVDVALIERDQWSLSSALDDHRPLFAVDMADGGRHYVSSRTGEVVLDTTRAERAWNWVGAVVHWVYPSALRSQPRLWHWVVVVLSGYTLLTALLGTVIGLLRWKRYANGRRSPYRGWMRWHHLLGLAGAVFVLAWLLSGLLSMNPGGVFPSRAPPSDWLSAWRDASGMQPTLPPEATGAKELEWIADGGGTLAWVRHTDQHATLWRGGHLQPVDEHFVRDRVRRLRLGEPVAVQRLTARDLHYHARTARRPLPVWRVQFSDGRWLHVDGQNGQPFARLDTRSRVARWLYHGLHSWDFEPLLQRRPLWDVLMLAALALGTALSVTSVVIAWQRLRPRRTATAPAPLQGRLFSLSPRP